MDTFKLVQLTIVCLNDRYEFSLCLWLQTDPVPRALQPVSGCADAVSSTIFIHYIFLVARQPNVTYLLRLLPLAAVHYDVDVVYNDATLHELVSCLATSPIAESFSNPELCTAVIDKFFLVSEMHLF
jgi:hypothetical protein